MNEYRIYAHITPSNKVYIGITKAFRPEKRWGTNGQGYKYNTHFWNAIQKYGWNNIRHIVLIENVSIDVANECEKYLIAKYKSNNSDYGYNQTEGGEGMAGFHFSEETKRKIGKANSIALKGRKIPDEVKAKISKSLSGENSPMYGKHPKPESIEKMRQKQIGNKYHLGCKATEEQRKRMSEAHKGLPLTQKQLDNLHKLHESRRGKHHSEETKQKIREAHLGRKRGPWTDAQRKAHMEANERRRKEKLQNTSS